MSRTLLIGGVAAVTLAALAGVATARQTPPPAMEHQSHAQRGDTDGDGRISQAEFVDRRVSRLTSADGDRDGSVTREELRAQGRLRMQHHAEARFARLDLDSDGAISREEFTAPRPARAGGAARPMRDHGGPGGHGPRMARHGGQGAERGPIAIAEVQARTEQAFTRLDADHDGYITAEESRAGKQQAREHRRERMAERRAAREASPQAPASE